MHLNSQERSDLPPYLMSVPSHRRGRMNPSTLLRMQKSGVTQKKSVHTLELAYFAGTWPATIYKAVRLGYLRRIQPGWFVATDLFDQEVRKAHNMRRQQ